MDGGLEHAQSHQMISSPTSHCRASRRKNPTETQLDFKAISASGLRARADYSSSPTPPVGTAVLDMLLLLENRSMVCDEQRYMQISLSLSHTHNVHIRAHTQGSGGKRGSYTITKMNVVTCKTKGRGTECVQG